MELPKGIQRIIDEYCYYPPKYINELRNSTRFIKFYMDKYYPIDIGESLLVVGRESNKDWNLIDLYSFDKVDRVRELSRKRNLLYTELGIKTINSDDLRLYSGTMCYLNY